MSAEDSNMPRGTSPGYRYYLQQPVIVMFLLGFSAGLPFLLVYSTLSAWLKDAGLQMSTISTFAWLGFAYSLKFVWAPFIDSLPVPVLTRLMGRRRSWMLLAQVGIACALLVMASTDPSQAIGVFATVALAVAFASATQDIVIDAYRIESAETRLQGVLAASYQYGYRLALLVAGAGALYIAEYGSWSLAYTAMSGCMVVGIATTFWCREPDVVVVARSYSGLGFAARIGHWAKPAVIDPLVDFFTRFGRFALLIILFIVFFRLSDYVLGILANPFYLDIGFSKAEIASVAKIYGIVVSLVGAGAGGWAVVKYGIARCLIIATVLIASTNRDDGLCRRRDLDAHGDDQRRQLCHGVRWHGLHRVPVESRQPVLYGDPVRAHELADEHSRQVHGRLFRQCPGGDRLDGLLPVCRGARASRDPAFDDRCEAPRQAGGPQWGCVR
jgi:PAT family beta-lactamase induction signal transducer AmpG